MSLNDAMDISVSGINANRIHMEIISSNLANINTTRTVQGGPYKRKVPLFAEKPLDFPGELSKAEKKKSGKLSIQSGELLKDIGLKGDAYNKPGDRQISIISVENLFL